MFNKIKSKSIGVLLVLLILVSACNQEKQPIKVDANKMHETMQHLTDVIVHDIFSPPVASRIYTYPSVGAYEILAAKDSSYKSLAGQLNGLTPIPPVPDNVNHEIAAIQTMLLLGKTLIFSEDKMDEFINEWHAELEAQGWSGEGKEATLAYADAVKKHILDWADKDNYKQTRTFEKFTVKEDVSRWQPTPPAYIEAIEPHWSKIRTFVIDSASQFTPEPPTEFSIDENSQFFKEVKQVYDVKQSLTPEQSEIASFWDCNPYVMNVHGHVMFATKKVTPGGHWIGIVKTVCKQTDASLMKSASAYVLTSLALVDGFISCWDEKYRSNLIRPETVINKYIDEEWTPLLQTPPFPEYTSGHSVISGAAGVALTSIFGEPFHFVDSTEVKYGLTAREFNSFKEASDEAAISRLYGGIHYMPAIENGVTQGRSLGKFIVDNVKLKEEE
ncbi:MAG: vanadium-dependent haloperoxidase [Fulvivirga sp.]|uniref:vanadium-dependent haloperoxidase n=2 Tax=Fulvivirga sp. TaxID=1931237 RepID=UPI0032EE9212